MLSRKPSPFPHFEDMAKAGLHLLLVLVSFHYVSVLAESAGAPDPAASSFIKASCRATRYPALCVHCLSSYAGRIQRSEKQLAHAALAVSLARARSAAGFVSKMIKVSGLRPRERQAVRDCVDNMGDTVDQLSRSMRELGRMRGGRAAAGGQDFMWHMSNVQTWVSAALTDENTCIDGFAGPSMDGNAKAAIKRRVIGVAQVTSNALALVNRFAARHGGRGAAADPIANLP